MGRILLKAAEAKLTKYSKCSEEQWRMPEKSTKKSDNTVKKEGTMVCEGIGLEKLEIRSL